MLLQVRSCTTYASRVYSLYEKAKEKLIGHDRRMNELILSYFQILVKNMCYRFSEFIKMQPLHVKTQ